MSNESLKNISRRHFLFESAAGLGAIAFGSVLGGCSGNAASGLHSLITDPMSPHPPHFPGKAKRVIYLHMAGAPSPLEPFYFEPEFPKTHNQPFPASLI